MHICTQYQNILTHLTMIPFFVRTSRRYLSFRRFTVSISDSLQQTSCNVSQYITLEYITIYHNTSHYNQNYRAIILISRSARDPILRLFLVSPNLCHWHCQSHCVALIAKNSYFKTLKSSRRKYSYFDAIPGNIFSPCSLQRVL